MAAPVCELCGNSNFTKAEGVFVCQSCGTKYTLEEAKRLMDKAEAAQATAAAVAAAPGVPVAAAPAGTTVVVNIPAPGTPPAPSPVPEPVAQAAAINSAADFNTAALNVAALGACGANNYICQGWQMIIDEYRKYERPTKRHQEQLVERAKECLLLLDNAARLEPEKYVQNTLIYENCLEIIESVKESEYSEKQQDGSWKKIRLSSSTDFKLAGQSESWEKKRDRHQASIEQEYLDAHPEDAKQREALKAQEAEIQSRLDDLKDEKKSKGFFNFADKKEVKDRMTPVKQELYGVQRQISEIDNAPKAYVEERLRDLTASFILLDF